VICNKIALHDERCNAILGKKSGENLLLFFFVVHQAGAVAACLCHLHAILVAQLVGLLHELLHLLHDHLVLLLILLLVGHLLGLLLRLLVARRIVRYLLLWLLWGLIPGIGYLVTASGGRSTSLLSLSCGLF